MGSTGRATKHHDTEELYIQGWFFHTLSFPGSLKLTHCKDLPINNFILQGWDSLEDHVTNGSGCQPGQAKGQPGESNSGWSVGLLLTSIKYQEPTEAVCDVPKRLTHLLTFESYPETQNFARLRTHEMDWSALKETSDCWETGWRLSLVSRVNGLILLKNPYHYVKMTNIIVIVVLFPYHPLSAVLWALIRSIPTSLDWS